MYSTMADEGNLALYANRHNLQHFLKLGITRRGVAMVRGTTRRATRDGRLLRAATDAFTTPDAA